MDPTGAEDPAGDPLRGGAGSAGGEPARGSLFGLLLAARRDELAAPTRLPAPYDPGGAGRAGPRVLIVAGTAQRRASIRARLEAGGFTTAEAADGAGALALADAARPAVAVVDLRLPDQVGFDIARQLGRAHPATRVVLHASVVTSTAIITARQAGAFALVIEHANEGCLAEFVAAAMPDHPAGSGDAAGRGRADRRPGRRSGR